MLVWIKAKIILILTIKKGKEPPETGCVTIGNKYGIHEFPDELLNYFRLRILRN